MFERYGPWSSALGDGHSTRLSTFWRRRLAMLSATRAAPTALSRRDWLKLGAAGLAAGAMPTLLLARQGGPAVAEPQGPGTIYIDAYINPNLGPDNTDSIMGVFAVDPETGTLVKITDLYGSVRVSRDGRTLAVTRSGVTGDPRREIEDTGVWTLDAAGKGEPRRVADFGGVTSWSPDGSQLIVARYSWDPEAEEAIRGNWSFNVDGTGATRLPIPETDSVQDWSPDGQWLVTVSDRHPPHGRGYQLYLMRPDGTDQRRLTEGGGLNVYPRFSPDSRQVAYLHSEKGGAGLWVVDIDGGGRRLVVREENDTKPDQLCWSPDGKSLAYTIVTWSRDEEGKKFIGGPDYGNPRLAIIAIDGTNLRPLDVPHARGLGAPDWR